MKPLPWKRTDGANRDTIIGLHALFCATQAGLPPPCCRIQPLPSNTEPVHLLQSDSSGGSPFQSLRELLFIRAEAISVVAQHNTTQMTLVTRLKLLGPYVRGRCY